MITINQITDTPIRIDFDLLRSYKRQGDIYLSNIRREMTKQLLVYTIYDTLQDMYNSYYVIIGGLLEKRYRNISELLKDEKSFNKQVDVFIEELKLIAPEYVCKCVIGDCKNVVLVITKLIAIVQEYYKNVGGK